jgi:RimJ/RimL family protein N-acetyltransferase
LDEDAEMQLPLETGRLILRRYRDEDVCDIVEFGSDPSVAVHLNGFPESTVEGVKKYIKVQQTYQPGEFGKCFDLAVELKAENKVIGLISLICHEHSQGEIGFALGDSYQRKGLASEAVRAAMSFGFDVLCLQRIYAQTERQNLAAWMLMERLGMRREAHFRHYRRRDGEWRDTYIYALILDEWGGTP